MQKSHWFLLTLLSAGVVFADDRPNMLFILTDDQGYGDLSCNGHPFIETPRIDAFRKECVRFENFHVGPSCSPTRAGLISGMHEFKSGVTHTKSGPRHTLHPDSPSIGDLLKDSGYRTVFYRKWHLGAPDPRSRGFDDFVDLRGEKPRETRMFFNPQVVVNGRKVGERVEGFLPDILTDQAIKYIEDHQASGTEDPFCMFFWTVTPHAPVMAPETYLGKFRGKMTETEAKYCAMVENIDSNVGRLLDALEEEGLRDNTLVVLMNDNGTTLGLELFNAGMRGPKTTAWPGGTRAFSYWRYPGKYPPRNEGALTGYVDVYPTFAEIAEVEIPEEIASRLDGYSLVNLLESEKGAFPRDRLLFVHGGRWESGHAADHKYIQAGVRKGDHLAIRIDTCECREGVCVRGRAVRSGNARKMVYTSSKESTDFHWAVTDGWELYNTVEDPGCKNNLLAASPGLARELTGAYEDWWEEVYPQMIERGGDAPIPGAPSGK